jgi:DNA repair exonuclease SbcCD ATPase subunit
MEFTPSLSVLPSKWDYSLCSGGERKRIDMAMMFGLYDLYIHMYGQQCSLMVLDEVDGRLDTEGIESFIDVIYNDFHDTTDSRPRPDTILVISHRPEMLDAFPTKIMVKKREGFSFIESII